MTTNSTSEQLVLVTGGSGFIAVHCMLQLLNAGYQVMATVRSLTREPEVRAMLQEGGVDAGDRLTCIAADLSFDTNWKEAVNGCTYVLHVASPTPLNVYKHEDEMIIPARDGVLRVLRASRDAGVKRVVLTSAFGAIFYGHKPRTTPFTEIDWTNTTGKVPVYQKSKTLAERAAWDFIEKEGGQLELSVVNPVAVLGPVLGSDYSHSIHLIQNLMEGKMPGCPKINSAFVDVRDVADLHLRAMTDPAANGERFIATAGESIWLVEVAKVLKRSMGALAGKVSVKEVPSGSASIAEVFISCKKEIHYSRELILPQPALVRVLAGEVRIAAADRQYNFFAGDTMLIPHNQLGRMSKLPLEGQPCIAISILFRREILQQYYTAHPIAPLQHHITDLKVLDDHPLLESLFNSLLPYFKLAEALPADIASFKIEEAIRVLRAIDKSVDHLLGQMEEPGKRDLVDFMEKNYMFNLPLEKFGYLTGRSLTTFKKDFERTFKCTPGKWLTQKRLELAHYQIFEKKRKPSDVYVDVGFENLSHFSFAFKKRFGYNPTSLVNAQT